MLIMEKANGINRLILHSSFTNTIDELQDVKITLPNNPDPVLFDFQNQVYPKTSELVTTIDEISKIDLNLIISNI